MDTIINKADNHNNFVILSGPVTNEEKLFTEEWNFVPSYSGKFPTSKKVACVFLCLKKELLLGEGTILSKLKNLPEDWKVFIRMIVAEAIKLLDDLFPMLVGAPEVPTKHELMDLQFISESLEAVAELLSNDHLVLLNAEKYRQFLLLLAGEL